MPAAAPMARMAAKAEAREAAAPISTRTDFSALALFAASVTTDAEGRASVPVKLPDNLTRYRVMAVAVAGERSFGNGRVDAHRAAAADGAAVRRRGSSTSATGSSCRSCVQNQTDAPS